MCYFLALFNSLVPIISPRFSFFFLIKFRKQKNPKCKKKMSNLMKIQKFWEIYNSFVFNKYFCIDHSSCFLCFLLCNQFNFNVQILSFSKNTKFLNFKNHKKFWIKNLQFRITIQAFKNHIQFEQSKLNWPRRVFIVVKYKLFS